jgi:hypothetical protein
VTCLRYCALTILCCRLKFLDDPKTKNQKPKTKNQKPKTKNQKPKPKPQNPKTPKPQNPKTRMVV